jgi:hypothetical protein
MKKIPVIILFLITTAVLISKDGQLKRPIGPLSEGCAFCHKRVLEPDPSHPPSAFGCYTCHLGNPFSLEKKRAHFTLIRNPGDLHMVDKTCGKTGCHSEIASRVKNSLMATNRGILKTLQNSWLGIRGATTEVKDLMKENPPQNMAIDHYRKLCGGCHLWKARGDRTGEVGRRGGGCSDCHVVDAPQGKPLTTAEWDHPKMTTRIPSENCVKCHNRSARIGLSYFGRYESAGYGTPYEGRELNGRRLSGNRFYLHLNADVHLSKAGMECIDCHTGTGLMGDGKSYDRMEDQVDVTCGSCHEPAFSHKREPESLANRLLLLNRRVPAFKDGPIGFTQRGTPLYNLQKRDGKVLFFRKMDGRALGMDMTSREKVYHRLPGHERLSCQACHSPWIPQCYGCHLTYRRSGFQKDWLTGKDSPGNWKESRSYMRFSTPALGLKDATRIYPTSPCQVFVSVFDEAGAYDGEASFTRIMLSAFDPHTTTTRSRPCAECHGDPKALGLGNGILYYSAGEWRFRPTYDSPSSALPIPFPLDASVTLEGEALQAGPQRKARPFNRKEIHKILLVGLCVGCHKGYDDPIYQDFREARRRFQGERGLPCRGD